MPPLGVGANAGINFNNPELNLPPQLEGETAPPIDPQLAQAALQLLQLLVGAANGQQPNGGQNTPCTPGGPQCNCTA